MALTLVYHYKESNKALLLQFPT